MGLGNLELPVYLHCRGGVNLVFMQMDVPKISVIVRSMDRPLLSEALDSLAAQTYSNLEVLVVNATGIDHRDIDGACGIHPVRLISTGGPLARSDAANVGLASAQGEWVGFLDDDDWLSPDHYQRLMDVAHASQGRSVVYAGVAVRGPNREELDIAPFNSDFSLERLRLENYIPIHALIFNKKLLRELPRFDSSFEVYEDWDFLLQLAAQAAPFMHAPVVTAYYRASGTSGVGVVADTGKQLRARRQLFDKWKSVWSGSDIDAMLQVQRSQDATTSNALRAEVESLHGALTEAHKALDGVHAALASTQATLATRQSQVEAEQARNLDLQSTLKDAETRLNIADGKLYDILHSTSWRLTAPLRKVVTFKNRLKSAVRHRVLSGVQFVLGQTPWPSGSPVVTQGFAGEPIAEPGSNPKSPLISVVMPVYNACRANKQFLIKALDSIANQTYKNVELVIVDDGSTDETHAVCQEYLAAHPELRVQYLSKANGGQSSARNFGIKACHGEYVGFLDQDDEWYEDKLEKVVPWLADQRIDVLYTDSDSIDGDDNVTFGRIHGQYHCGWPHPKSSLEDVLFKDIFVMPGLMTIKRSAFEAVGGFDEKLSGYEDDDLFLRLYEQFKFFYLPIPTLRWRMYGDNYSFSHRMLTSRMYFWRKLLANYTDQGRNRYREHMISLRFFWQFMGQAKMQYQVGNAMCWDSFNGAKQIQPHLPWLQRMIFSLVFLFPDRRMLPLLARTRATLA